MNIEKTFCKDRKHWKETDFEEIKYFFASKPFYNKINLPFEELLDITFYAFIDQYRSFELEKNKHSEVLFLLRGEIIIEKREKRNKKIVITKEIHIFKDEPIQINLGVNALISTSIEAEIIYVPSFFYESAISRIQNKENEEIFVLLKSVFPLSSKTDISLLSRSGCSLEKYRIFHEIYRIKTVPEFVYILLEGTVRSDNTLISINSLFGNKDISEKQRVTNAISYTAESKVIKIEKKAYLQFVKTMKYNFIEPIVQIAKIESEEKSSTEELIRKLPKLFDRPANTYSELKMYNNCHMIVSFSASKSKKSFRSPESPEKNCSFDQFLEKFKFVKKRRPHTFRIDLNNKLF